MKQNVTEPKRIISVPVDSNLFFRLHYVKNKENRNIANMTRILIESAIKAYWTAIGVPEPPIDQIKKDLAKDLK